MSDGARNGAVVPPLNPRTRRSRWAAARVRGAPPDNATPADEVPADEAQAPTDLVSDSSESTDSSSDSDDSSVVAVVEPVDQAAEVPCVADLLAASDFTQHLLNDLHAPMVTVILEEQVLARPRIGTDASS